MQLHEINPTHKNKSRKRIGRGGKRGVFSGKGVKGQRSRSGRKFSPIMRELIKRYPKLRGYKNKGKEIVPMVLDIGDLEKNFSAKAIVNPQILCEKRLVRRVTGRFPRVKILGGGRLTKALTIEKCEISKQAKEKIEKAGGIIK